MLATQMANYSKLPSHLAATDVWVPENLDICSQKSYRRRDCCLKANELYQC